MADWATISSLATAGGTLVLGVATFASVRSANRSARIAESALQEQRRPVLAASRLEDPLQKIMFAGGHWVRADGGRGVAEHVDGVVYLALSLRNVGAGIGVLHGWQAWAGLRPSGDFPDHASPSEFAFLSVSIGGQEENHGRSYEFHENPRGEGVFGTAPHRYFNHADLGASGSEGATNLSWFFNDLRLLHQVL